MTDIHTVPIEPDGIHGEGDIIDLPKEIGRVDTFHDTRPAGGTNFEMTVLGRGDLEEHVLLNTGGPNPSVEEGAQFLATNVEQAEVWYAIPLSQYRGDSE